MRDRNEKASEAASTGLVPIGLFNVLHVAKWRRIRYAIRRKGQRRFIEPVITNHQGVTWNPRETHDFLRRMLGED